MSFSGEVKEELVRFLPEARHCGIAELAAILEYTKAVKCDEKGAKYIEIEAVCNQCGILVLRQLLLCNIYSIVRRCHCHCHFIQLHANCCIRYIRCCIYTGL